MPRILFAGLLPVLLLSFAVPLASAAPRREKVDAKADAEAERLELAREHFLRGEQLASSGELHGALLELELAELAHPSASVTEAKRRVRARLDESPPVAPPTVLQPEPAQQRAPLRRFIAPLVIAPIAFGALIAGGAVLGTVRHDVSALQHDCSPSCSPSSTSALRVREPVAYALLGGGAALAVVDAVLWGVLATRRHADARTASLAPFVGLAANAGSLGVKGIF